jgi:hypothetical protein
MPFSILMLFNFYNKFFYLCSKLLKPKITIRNHEIQQ